MTDLLPRRQIDELVTRWQLTAEKMLVLEGPSDRRFMHLVQQEDHCDESLASLVVMDADTIDVPVEVVLGCGFDGTGAKQRVIAFAESVERANATNGFRGVIDRDQDPLLGRDHRSSTVSYTDFGCIEAYGWSVRCCRQLVVQYQCEGSVPTLASLRRLYESINAACMALAAVRAAAQLHPEWDLKLDQYSGTLQVSGSRVQINIDQFIRRAGAPRGKEAEIRAEVERLQEEASALGPLTCINGHDLVWVLLVALRELTRLPRRAVDESAIAGAVVSCAVTDPELLQHQLFRQLVSWASC